jgi:AbrB family looped-hinge helix DNA binding protein
MAKKSRDETGPACCTPPACSEGYRVEALVAVDERGQMVLPKELRDKAGILPGEKLAVVSRERDGKVCCLYIFKADALVETVKDTIIVPGK